jgi:rhamnosyl/mannosyltransferase
VSRERTVVFVTPFFPPHVGGVETYVHGLATALHALPGWRAVVVTTGGRGKITSTHTQDGIRVYQLPAIATFSYTPIDLRWPSQIRRILRAEQPDYLNVHTPVPGLADAASLVAGTIPVIVTYHAASLAKAGHPLFNTVARTYLVAEDVMLRRASLILGVSEYVADHLRHRHPDKVGVLENAVSQETLGHPPAGDRPYAAAFMARLDPTHAWKGLEQLLRAMHIYITRFTPSARLLVIGDGTARPGYEALTRELGIAGNVTFAGNLSGEAKFRALRSANSLALCPTSPNDAFPTVMLEAWANRVPVIATTIGPLPSLIRNGSNGLLAPPQDPESLAENLHALNTTPTLAAKIQSNAHELVRTRYTWDHRVAEFTEKLTSISSGRALQTTR